MTFCSIDQVLPQASIEYASPITTRGALPRFIQAPPVQSGYALYPDLGENDTRNGWYIICPQQAFNLVRNPTFFNGLDSWSTFNATMSRTNANSFDSGFSVLIRGSGDTVTAERRAYIESEVTGFIPGQNYVFSMYLWSQQEWDSQDDFIGTLSIVDFDGVTFEEVFSQRLDKSQRWDRIAVTKTIRTNATQVFVRVNLRSQDQQEIMPPYNPTGNFNLKTEYIYADFAQFEIGITPTTPFHGDYRTCATEDQNCGPYTWSGTAHNSISERSDCTRDGGKLISLSSLGFEILEHTGHGAPPVRDVYFDYANRPGGEYQKTAVDTNVITLSGYVCEKNLRELECAIFGIKDKIMPDIANCRGKMLLVYVHQECKNVTCDPERFVAYCVTYIGGIEGVRDNLFQQRMALQFRAHDPFAFEWPGQTSHPLSFNTIIQEKAVVRIGLDDIQGFPLTQGDYRTLTCMQETNKFLLGGDFEGVNATDESQGLTVFDCSELCEQNFVGGAVNVSIRDDVGNVYVGGSFTAPFNRVAIYYPGTNGWGGFGYGGADVTALAAPFWGQVVVGTANSVEILINIGDNFISYATDGQVNDFVVDSRGNLYAFGDFTTIDGVSAGGIAVLRVNETGCLDVGNSQWESLGFDLDGPVNSADIQGDTIYFGGAFTNATPNQVDLCDTIEGLVLESKGANQSVQFSDLGGGIFRLDFQLVNPLSQGFTNGAFFTDPNLERMVRFTAKSTLGSTYVFLIPQDALVGNDFTTITGGNIYTVSIDIDTTYVLGGVCATLNPELIEEINTDLLFIQSFANVQYPSGTVGLDDSINSVTIQRVQRQEFFQGDTVVLNNVGCLTGDKVTALDQGIPVAVNKVFVHPDTGQILVGTETGSGFTDGLAVWSGRDWCPFPADLGEFGADNRVLDIDYCNCSLYLLFEGNGVSVLPGVNNIEYNGSVEKFDYNLIIHGPGRIHTFQNGLKEVKFCTKLQCGEVARLNFGNGSFSSTSRNLAPTLLSGSQYDLSLGKCNNPIKILITDTDTSTKATLSYERCYWGIEGLCCSPANKVQIVDNDNLDVCCSSFIRDIRIPTQDDCNEEGYEEGDEWLAFQGNCNRFFINAGEECCDDVSGQYVGGGGTYYTGSGGTQFCQE